MSAKKVIPVPVVTPAELNIEVHPPGTDFLDETVANGRFGEEPAHVALANFCRPAVRWKGRVATLDFNGFVRAGICAIEAELAK